MTPLIVACIPAYNEHMSIAETINKVTRYVEQVIVCDDGSKDGTGKIAEQHSAIVIRNTTNQGKCAALGSYFKTARKISADVVVSLIALPYAVSGSPL